MGIYSRVKTQKTNWPGTPIPMEWSNQFGFDERPRLDSVLAYKGQHVKLAKSEFVGVVSPQPPVFAGQCLNWTDCYEELAQAKNRALAKYFEKLGLGGALGTSLLEGRESLGMIASRCRTLRNAALALRRGRFRDFLKHLRLAPFREHKGKRKCSPKEASSLWLEYWLGWAPLLGDIFHAVDRLQHPYQLFSVSATSMTPVKRYFHTSGSSGSTTQSFAGVGLVRVGADVRVQNENLYLANQLGLTNPASVAWDLVGGSFLVNWFVPVNLFLQQMSAHLGLSVKKGYSTALVKGRESSRYTFKGGKSFSAEWSYVYMRRTPGIPNVSLVASLPRASISRAATAVSLLIQSLNFLH